MCVYKAVHYNNKNNELLCLASIPAMHKGLFWWDGLK